MALEQSPGAWPLAYRWTARRTGFDQLGLAQAVKLVMHCHELRPFRPTIWTCLWRNRSLNGSSARDYHPVW